MVQQRKSSKASSQVIYVRNLDQVDMNQQDLMTETLPTTYLYAKVNVGEQAAHFFTETMLGADFDRRLREKHQLGYEALMSANPQDAAAVQAAQLECLVVVGIYDMINQALTEGNSCKQQLVISDDDEDKEE